MKIVLAFYLISATAGFMSAQTNSPVNFFDWVKELGGWGAFLVLVYWLVKKLEVKLDTLIEVTRNHNDKLVQIQSTLDDSG